MWRYVRRQEACAVVWLMARGVPGVIAMLLMDALNHALVATLFYIALWPVLTVTGLLILAHTGRIIAMATRPDGNGVMVRKGPGFMSMVCASMRPIAGSYFRRATAVS